jgi:hypothetical protein
MSAFLINTLALLAIATRERGTGFLAIAMREYTVQGTVYLELWRTREKQRVERWAGWPELLQARPSTRGDGAEVRGDGG